MEYEKQFQFLKSKFEAGQLSHAYVFSGDDGGELKKFAKELVKLINGKSVAGAEAAIEREQFPDLFVVKSQNSKSSLKDDEDKQEIDISLIREAQNFLSYKSYYGGYKTVIIENAERMNVPAQNCFLKNLEEPKGDSLIILLSLKPEMLLSTIFSRCQQIKFTGKKTKEEALSQELQSILHSDLAEKFKYAKTANLEGGNFENILKALQNHWRKDIEKYRSALKLALDLEYKVQVFNINKKLALEILLLEI